jgi:hypothetical protein
MEQAEHDDQEDRLEEDQDDVRVDQGQNLKIEKNSDQLGRGHSSLATHGQITDHYSNDR